jgi:hypothetical protein
MIRKFFGVLLAPAFGVDVMRDKESFFIALALEFGYPKPLKEHHVRVGGKKAPIHIANTEPDLKFILRFSELAHTSGLSCQNEKELARLHEEYCAWYARQHPQGAHEGGSSPSHTHVQR